jgi:hypothetical protein
VTIRCGLKFSTLHGGYDWPDEYSGRALVNRFSKTWHGREDALVVAGEDERRRYAAAAAAGDVDTALVFAGEGVDLIHDIEPAGVILNRIVTEAESALAQQFGESGIVFGPSLMTGSDGHTTTKATVQRVDLLCY